MSAAAPSRSAVGRAVAVLETPALTVDLARLEANLERAACYATERGLRLHPHTKTHKTLEIARMQLAAGAAGLTVAKSTEAAIFAAERAPLLAHYPPVGPEKVRRLVEVAGELPLTVAVDSAAAAEPLARALVDAGAVAEALVEVDVGLGRTGVAPVEALQVAQRLEALGGLRVAGISCYPGHLGWRAGGVEAGLEAVAATLAETIALFDAAGIRCDRVSGGSTATLLYSHLTPATELRPGNYAFLDRAEAVGPYALSDCALRVWATVVSRPSAERVVLDSGSKTLSEAGPPPGESGFGVAPEHSELEIAFLNEEHAVARLTGESELRVGDRVELIPNHACTAVNLHDTLYAVRDGIVEAELDVVARGAVQ